jgi:tetratricopeptide (TPR) repeat protein
MLLGALAWGPPGGAGCEGAGPSLAALEQALDRREWAEAETLLPSLEASSHDCAAVRLGRARLLAARGRAAEAERLFEEAAVRASGDATVHARFAEFWLSRGQPARADYHSALALSLAQDNAHALVVQARLLNGRGRAGEAREALEKAIQADPSHAEAHYQLGVWSFRARQTEAAAGRFEKAAALRPRDSRALDYLALSLEALGRAEEAEQAYQRALKVNEGPFFDALLEHNYGRFLLKQGRLADSRRHLDRAVELLPESRAVHYERGKLNLAARDYAAARADAERAQRLPDPEGLVLDVQVYYLMATVYSRLGETELARKYAELSRTTPIPER